MALALVALWGCSEIPATQVRVVFDAEEALLDEAHTIRVQVWSQEGEAVLDDTRVLEAVGSGPLATVYLVPRSDDAGRSFAIEATLSTRVGESLGSVEAGGGYRDGELVEVRLRFTRACRDVGDCGRGRTCDAGICVGSCVEGGEGPARPLCGECGICVGAECVARDDGAACGCVAVDQCIGGVCAPAARTREMALGRRHTCALTDRVLSCWGDDTRSQLGTSAGGAGEVALERAAVGAAGDVHTCWLTFGMPPERYCWGWNGAGRLGLGSTDDGRVSTPTRATEEPAAFTSMTAGWSHTCARDGAGTAWCWGENVNGQVGQPVAEEMFGAPTRVEGGPWSDLSAGGLHTCGVDDEGGLWCWGLNSSGQLGIGDLLSTSEPTRVVCSESECPLRWSRVFSGWFHTCALDDDARLWCWGGGRSGQLGLGVDALEDRVSPGLVGGTWLRAAAGERHTCAIAQDGALWCWGANDAGQLGLGDTVRRVRPEPLRVRGERWAAVEAGGEHTCAIAEDQSLWCWGDDEHGQTGVVGSGDVLTPSRVCFN